MAGKKVGMLRGGKAAGRLLQRRSQVWQAG